MVTIKEIARQAGVSTTTVSNVLHKKNARVSAETIEKVERLLAENNYIPRLGKCIDQPEFQDYLYSYYNAESLPEALLMRHHFTGTCWDTWRGF